VGQRWSTGQNAYFIIINLIMHSFRVGTTVMHHEIVNCNTDGSDEELLLKMRSCE
jgi:hypothetical protein